MEIEDEGDAEQAGDDPADEGPFMHMGVDDIRPFTQGDPQRFEGEIDIEGDFMAGRTDFVFSSVRERGGASNVESGDIFSLVVGDDTDSIIELL